LIALYRESKNVNIYYVDILNIGLICNDFIKKSDDFFDILAGIKDFMGTALICFLRSA